MFCFSRKSLKTGTFSTKMNLKMGMGFEARAAHPTQSKSERPWVISEKIIVSTESSVYILAYEVIGINHRINVINMIKGSHCDGGRVCDQFKSCKPV